MEVQVTAGEGVAEVSTSKQRLLKVAGHSQSMVVGATLTEGVAVGAEWPFSGRTGNGGKATYKPSVEVPLLVVTVDLGRFTCR